MGQSRLRGIRRARTRPAPPGSTTTSRAAVITSASISGWPGSSSNWYRTAQSLRDTTGPSLGRAVRFLAGQGVRQFIDLGSGIPTVGNVHEIAQKFAPRARVVYVDNDPVAVVHGQTLLADSPRTAVIEADLRRTDAILAHPDLRTLVDLSQPVAVLAEAVLHFLLDGDDPQAVVGRYRDNVAPGSYLVISHLTSEHRAQEMTGIGRLGAQAGTRRHHAAAPRSRPYSMAGTW
jgi:S-adenosyl methyltransferase